MFSTFPRDVADPKRRVVNSRAELKRWVEERNGRVDCFVSVYGSDQRIDKIFIDIDGPYGDMKKLHDWLAKHKYKHVVFFSGGGYHVYVFTTGSSLQYPKNALRNAQIYITECAGVNADRQVFGDVRRVARIPQTWNPKRKLFCIPLTNRDIHAGEDHIRELARKQHNTKSFFIGKELFDLLPYDAEPAYNGEAWKMEEGLKTMTITSDMIESFSPCILSMLKKSNVGHRDRFIILSYLKDRGLLMDEAIDVLRRFLDNETLYHCIAVERQPENIWDRDIMVPTCDSLRREGRCAVPDGSCEAHLEGSPI